MKKITVDYDVLGMRYPNGEYNPLDNPNRDRYRPAYLTTNECLDDFISATDVRGGDVLTVAASGDQPLLYAASGAGRVDTFDLTYSAKVIMDLKVAALGHMDRMQYLKLINDLRKSQDQNTPIMDVEGMAQIVQTMPPDSAEFLRRMSKSDVFSAGIRVAGAGRSYRPSLRQYNKMKRVIKAPFNFIWTDISHLSRRVTEKYDIVNISNILEWLSDARGVSTLQRLFPLLRAGGYIQATHFDVCYWTEDCFRNAANELGACAGVKYMSTPNEGVARLYRLR